MHHLNLLKLGFAVVTAISGNANASPSEFALEMVKQLANKALKRPAVELQHCGVCHEVNLRHLKLAA